MSFLAIVIIGTAGDGDGYGDGRAARQSGIGQRCDAGAAVHERERVQGERDTTATARADAAGGGDVD